MPHFEFKVYSTKTRYNPNLPTATLLLLFHHQLYWSLSMPCNQCLKTYSKCARIINVDKRPSLVLLQGESIISSAYQSREKTL